LLLLPKNTTALFLRKAPVVKNKGKNVFERAKQIKLKQIHTNGAWLRWRIHTWFPSNITNSSCLSEPNYDLNEEMQSSAPGSRLSF
jgi:hypothetical protein